MSKLEVLRKSDVFHYLDDDELNQLERMATPEVFEPGTVIFRQDTDAEKLYVIEEGLVSIILEMGPTDRRQIQSAGDAECFSWSALIPPFRHVFMVKAVEKTKVLAFNGKELRNLIYTNPKLFAEIMRGLAYVIAHRLRTAFVQLMGVTYQK